MLGESQYIMDSNVFIAPHNKYYAFDLAPRYWENLKAHIKSGRIILFDMVVNELATGKDELYDWILPLCGSSVFKHAEQKIVDKYGEVLRYVQECGYYSDNALNDWSMEHVADPWLIATAAVQDFVIVSAEVRNPNLGKGGKIKRAKIPDVADHFLVKTIDLFDMMRELGITV